MMVDMQKGDLVVALSQHKEHRVHQIDDLQYVIEIRDPHDIRHLGRRQVIDGRALEVHLARIVRIVQRL